MKSEGPQQLRPPVSSGSPATIPSGRSDCDPIRGEIHHWGRTFRAFGIKQEIRSDPSRVAWVRARCAL